MLLELRGYVHSPEAARGRRRRLRRNTNEGQLVLEYEKGIMYELAMEGRIAERWVLGESFGPRVEAVGHWRSVTRSTICGGTIPARACGLKACHVRWI